MNNKAVNKLVDLPFVIAGIIFVISGIFLFKNTKDFMTNATKTSGVISDIVCTDDNCKVTVEFSVGSMKYTGELKEYSSLMKKGNTIIIYYDPQNPDNFKENVSYTISYVFIGIGSLVSAAGLYVMIKTNLKYKKYTNVKVTGIKIEAKIVSIEIDNSVSKSGVNPYYVTCVGVNPVTRDEEIYRSEDIWFDVRKIIDDNHLEVLPVYIDVLNLSNYYVDVSLLKTYNK